MVALNHNIIYIMSDIYYGGEIYQILHLTLRFAEELMAMVLVVEVPISLALPMDLACINCGHAYI